MKLKQFLLETMHNFVIVNKKAQCHCNDINAFACSRGASITDCHIFFYTENKDAALIDVIIAALDEAQVDGLCARDRTCVCHVSDACRCDTLAYDCKLCLFNTDVSFCASQHALLKNMEDCGALSITGHVKLPAVSCSTLDTNKYKG